MDTQSQLLAEIEDFIGSQKIAATTFGKMAVNDGKFVSRLRSGANMTLATIARVKAFLETQRRASSEAA
jgi:hypothetical protein